MRRGVEVGTAPGARAGRRLHVTGVVQGVGFRPFVHRLALRHGLAGSVRNESGEVFVEIEGNARALDGFEADLRSEAPLLARIDSVEKEPIPVRGLTDFEVLRSRATSTGRLPISPDVALCDPCQRELEDPSNRRFRYPFITCTDCGPRYTVIEVMPYDRERTSMRAFRQCPRCETEYRNPADRRYHSETNSCPECGPRIWLTDPAGAPVEEGWEALESAAEMLRLGGVLAIRGLGGYHLAVDATSETAVRQLRIRKMREEKPLALMVRTLEDARRIGFVSPAEERLLTSRERPIVLLRRRPECSVAPSVSPGLDTLGVMIAYTPLHHLLLERAGRPLVMTSGNVSELPICTSNSDALARLPAVASGFLMHDREIVSRYDDSVLRVAGGETVFLRRARGYAPLPVELPLAPSRPIVAVGPHLKNTFTLATGDQAYVSQHIGDLENVETLDHFRDSLARFQQLFRIDPAVVARDLHPGYLSTRIAEEMALPTIAVQHHHAHIAAVAAEHGETGPVVGVAYDGTGYGDDGAVWGAEVLLADLQGYRRVGRLRYAPLPGGDLAVRVPWRVVAGYLALEPGREASLERAFEGIPRRTRHVARAQADRGVNAPPASSMGRLFDAAAAVLGVRREASYEGQAAMELEALARRILEPPAAPSAEAIAAAASGDGIPALEFPARLEEGTWIMDPLPLLGQLGERALRGEAVPRLAAAFHLAVARTTVEVVQRVCVSETVSTAALGGGVFQNALLLPLVTMLLRRTGIRVLVPRTLSPNDGAISYGQAAVAAARLSAAEGR